MLSASALCLKHHAAGRVVDPDGLSSAIDRVVEALAARPTGARTGDAQPAQAPGSRQSTGGAGA